MNPYYHSLQPESISDDALDHLLALGWYRMHQSIFTSSHVGLDEIYRVHWLRYALAEIREHSSHRRIQTRNSHFQWTIEDVTLIRPDHQQLHKRYRASIDFDGANSIEECLFGDEEVGKSIYRTKSISIFDRGRLIAGGYFDVGRLAAASILHFYDPSYKKFSLGKHLILLTVDYLRKNQFEFYYPGYVVEGHSKMNYKLFLGQEEAQYFDPEIPVWKYFDEKILVRQPLPE